MAQNTSNNTILGLAAELAAGRTTSRALVEEALTRIDDPTGDGRRVFLRVNASQAREAADRCDELRQRDNAPASPLAGLPISAKDLFDVAGEVTSAGSKVLANAPPASDDAEAIARLRAAGAILIGRTNMTEFAFSGVGLNPHYGTPGNPFDRTRIPGGSSSGAAVSVSERMVVVGIGTDTGGSVRIPAAFCDLVGFKPTQERVSRKGVLPLSTTLDSVGPIANSVTCCAIVNAIMAGETADPPAPIAAATFRLGIPQTLVLEGLDPTVAVGFNRACSTISCAGAHIVDLPLRQLLDYREINRRGGFVAYEAHRWHASLLAERGELYDARVRARIERGSGTNAAEYAELFALRERFVHSVNESIAGIDALLMPTVPIVAPEIAAFDNDSEFARLNALILRNPSIINFLDGCAITLPIPGGDLPVGLMIAARSNEDRRLLGIAREIEQILQR